MLKIKYAYVVRHWIMIYAYPLWTKSKFLKHILSFKLFSCLFNEFLVILFSSQPLINSSDSKKITFTWCLLEKVHLQTMSMYIFQTVSSFYVLILKVLITFQGVQKTGKLQLIHLFFLIPSFLRENVCHFFLFLRALRSRSPQRWEAEDNRIKNIFNNSKYPERLILKACLGVRKLLLYLDLVPQKKWKNPVSYVSEINALKPACQKLDFNIGFKYTSTTKNF